MIDKVISGGQSGVDQAALRAARSLGIPTGGTAPKGWLAEVLDVYPDGHTRWVMRPCPWLAEYGLVECEEEGFPARSRANVLAADGTLWIGDIDSKGFAATHDPANRALKPFYMVFGGTKPSEVRAWVEAKGVRVLNVAGNRESVSPGIGERAEAFLVRVLGAWRRPGG